MTVLDASAAICFLLNRPPDRAALLQRRLLGQSLQAPHLIDLEIVQSLRRFVQRGDLPPGRAQEALTDLAEMRISRYPHYPFLGRVWQLRHNLSAYDASYVALAELLETPLLTLDARIARPGVSVAVEVF